MKEGRLVKQRTLKGPVRRRPKRRRGPMSLKRLKARAKEWERDTFKKRFDLEVFYRGLDGRKDKAVEKAARRPSEGSGMVLMSGLRDMNFEFKTEGSALVAAARIKKAVRGVRCMLRSCKRV